MKLDLHLLRVVSHAVPLRRHCHTLLQMFISPEQQCGLWTLSFSSSFPGKVGAPPPAQRPAASSLPAGGSVLELLLSLERSSQLFCSAVAPTGRRPPPVFGSQLARPARPLSTAAAFVVALARRISGARGSAVDGRFMCVRGVAAFALAAACNCKRFQPSNSWTAASVRRRPFTG